MMQDGRSAAIEFVFQLFQILVDVTQSIASVLSSRVQLMNSSQTAKEFVLLQLIPLKPFLLMTRPLLSHMIQELTATTSADMTALQQGFHIQTISGVCRCCQQ